MEANATLYNTAPPSSMETVSAPQLIAAIRADQIIGGISIILVTMAFATRVYVRSRMTKQWAAQDWAMVAAFIFAFGHIGASLANCSVSMSLASGDSTVLPLYHGLYRLAGITFILCIIALKISVGMFFLYIFSAERYHRYFIYAIMFLSTLFGIIYLPFGVFTCAQFRSYADEGQSCSEHIQLATEVLFALFTIITIIGDFGYCLMGVLALWRATMPRATKAMASFLICLGSVGGITSVIRLVLLLIPANFSRFSQEELWLVRVILIEVAVSVIAANLAMTRPLFQKVGVRMGLIKGGAVTGGGFSMVTKGRRRSGESEIHLVDPKIMVITPSDEIYELEA